MSHVTVLEAAIRRPVEPDSMRRRRREPERHVVEIEHEGVRYQGEWWFESRTVSVVFLDSAPNTTHAASSIEACRRRP